MTFADFTGCNFLINGSLLTKNSFLIKYFEVLKNIVIGNKGGSDGKISRYGVFSFFLQKRRIKKEKYEDVQEKLF